MNVRRVKKRAAQARREIQRTWENPSPFAMPPTMRAWHTKYTRLICELMMERLPDERLVEWRFVFTALHELVAVAYGESGCEGVRDERRAWDRVWPNAHYAVRHLCSLNPPGVEPEHFVEEYLAWFAFLAERGVIGEEVAARLSARYRAARERSAA